jgi:ATP-dependent protease ClpP protease subunit
MKKTTKEKLLEKNIYPISEVTHSEINSIMKWIDGKRPDEEEFTLLINSAGGTPSAALSFACFMDILEEEVSVTGVAVNECGSAALAILQCCHKRIAVRQTAFFIHHIVTNFSMSCFNPDFDEIKRKFEESRHLEEQLIQMQCKRSKMSRDSWMKIADYGARHSSTPIFMTKARELNLIDEIVDSFPCI